jgi:O-antigen/teichoic acid export membrane protein
MNITKIIPTIVLNFISNGHERSIKAKKNIFFSLGLQGISIIISLVQVPLTLNYIDKTRYGIWLTLSSILVWFNFFDIGLGNGLRNKFAEAKALNDQNSARIYISTTYALLSLIILPLIVVFYFIYPFINWSFIFNSPPEVNKELNLLILFVFAFFSLQFILKIITTILTADQKPAISNFIGTIGAILSLISIIILTKTTKGSLLYLGLAFSVSPVIVLFFATVLLFTNQYKQYRPSFHYVEMKYAKSLMNVGIQFFIISISAVVMFQTQNIIITQLYGPKEVIPYNIAFKYFGIITMFFSIIITPFWSAYTEAYFKNDFTWIISITKKLIKIWILFFIAGLFMLLFSGIIYKLWLHGKVIIPFTLSLSMFVYVSMLSFGSIFVSFLNGIGKIKAQLYTSLFTMLASVPFSIFLCKYLHFGIIGIIVSACLLNFYGYIIAPIQYYRIIKNEKKLLKVQ